MKRWAVIIVIVAAASASIYVSEHHASAPVGPNALLHIVGDTEREATRVPMHFTRLSDEEEVSIGDSIAQRYDTGFRAHWNTETDVPIEKYVQRIGRNVAGHAKRRLPYSFHYVPEDEFINAFALPGGHVFIGKGMLLLMDSEDELAAVLGHEVEHIDRYHCAERVQTESRLRGLPLGELIALPVMIFQAGYSKEQELEADREGTRLAVLAGYSPEGSIRLFESLAQLQAKYLTH